VRDAHDCAGEAVREVRPALSRDPQGQSGLADAAWTDEGEQACIPQQPLDIRQLALASNKAGQWFFHPSVRGWDCAGRARIQSGPRTLAGRQQLAAPDRVQSKTIGELRERLLVRRAPRPAFQVGDATTAEPRPFRQLFLSQPAVRRWRRSSSPKPSV
jgi:hypothetical protein